MKKTILIFFIHFACFSGVLAQFKSGLIISGGKGNLSNVQPGSNDIMKEIFQNNGTGTTNYKFNIAVGYKFRIEPQSKPFFYDLDIYIGMKSYTYEYTAEKMQDSTLYFYGNSGNINLYYTSLKMSWNYKIIKGLYAGAGIEPTIYLNNDSSRKFDIPLSTQIGYNFKYVEVIAGYKLGLFNTLPSGHFESGRFNDWQIQVFIPF